MGGISQKGLHFPHEKGGPGDQGREVSWNIEGGLQIPVGFGGWGIGGQKGSQFGRRQGPG